ncbi:neutral zinc metallopeptidase [Halovulum marinum]|nr:neutral zinc metallopeptidase [Halovulum marinum]
MIRAALLVLSCLAAVPAAVPVAAAAQVQMAAVNPKSARMVEATVRAAGRLFPNLPAVRLTSAIGRVCGGPPASELVRYCTSANLVYLAADIDQRLSEPAAAYLVAHQLGHAAQLRAGIAARADTPELRAALELQADCLAGVILSSTETTASDPAVRAATDHLTAPHWGAEPIENGRPEPLPPTIRGEWLQWGYREADAGRCEVGDLPAAFDR